MGNNSSKLKISSKDVVAMEVAASADYKFCADLYNKLADPSKNMVMSSFSVSVVLAMILAGARKNTAAQIVEGLGQKSEEKTIAGYGAISRAIESLKKEKDITLVTANKIFQERRFKVHQEYKDLLKEHFLTSVEYVDFFNNHLGARMEINKWVEDQTNKKIQDLLKLDAVNRNTKLAIVNAIYFKGDWEKKFTETLEEDFHVNESKTETVQMMFQKSNLCIKSLKQLGGALALQLPYEGELIDMIFILPPENVKLEALNKKLSSVDLSRIKFNQNTKKLVEVYIPRFKIESDHDLIEKLMEMGMKDMFNRDDADFSGMTKPGAICVTTFVQKAFIEVNEEGTEATAATAAIFGFNEIELPESEPMIFDCNRPFYFYIQERKTGLVLFFGKVINPNEI